MARVPRHISGQDVHSDGSARLVREPTLQLIAFVRREPSSTHADASKDPRRLLLRQVGLFMDGCADHLYRKYGAAEAITLRANGDWQSAGAAGPGFVDQQLENLTSLPDGRWESLTADLQVVDAQGNVLELYSCSLYTCDDVVVVHVCVSRYGPLTCTLTDGWHELVLCLRWGFDDELMERASEGTFGVSLLYWAIARDGTKPADYAPAAVRIVTSPADGTRGATLDVRSTQTDVGTLWRGDVSTFPAAPKVAQDAWVLVTPDHELISRRVNRNYFDRRSAFVLTSLARQKFRSQQAQFLTDRPLLNDEQRGLDRWAEQLLGTIGKHPARAGRDRAQPAHRHGWVSSWASRLMANDAPPYGSGPDITHFRSRDSESFQEDLRGAANELAIYRAHASEVKRLLRGLQVARQNYLIHCIPLISSAGARRVEQSDSQVKEALAFLSEWQARGDGGDEFFRSELGRMQGVCEQVEADLDYSDWIVDRNAAALRSGTEQLQIAGQRELGEISHHLALDSAAVVASLLAFVVVEALVKPLAFEQSVIGLGLVLSVASLAFTVLVWLASGSKAKGRLELGSLGLTLALLLVSLAFAIAVQLGLSPEGAHAEGSAGAEARGLGARPYFFYFGAAVTVTTLVVWAALWRWRAARAGGREPVGSGDAEPG